MIDHIAATQFFWTMFEPSDLILARYFAPDGTPRTSNYSLGELPQLFAEADALAQQQYGAFFGVCPREAAGMDKQHQIRKVNCLSIDIDHVTVPEALSRIAHLPKPTAVINSGYGCHVYWRLFQSFIIDDAAPGESKLSPKANYIRSICYGLLHEAQGDKSTYDLSRILRIPTSDNFKQSPARQSQVYVCNPYIFNLDAFDKYKLTINDDVGPDVDDAILANLPADDRIRAARAEMQGVERSVTENDGSKRLVLYGKIGKSFALGLDQTVSLVREVAVGSRAFSKDWTDQDIKRRYREAKIAYGERVPDELTMAGFPLPPLSGPNAKITKKVADELKRLANNCIFKGSANVDRTSLIAKSIELGIGKEALLHRTGNIFKSEADIDQLWPYGEREYRKRTLEAERSPKQPLPKLDPGTVAEAFLNDQRCISYEKHVYASTLDGYVAKARSHFDSKVVGNWLLSKYENCTNSAKQSVVSNVHALIPCVDSRVQFLVSKAGWDARFVVACRNKLVNANTFETVDNGPDFFSCSPTPVDYNPTASRPVEWLKFLESLWDQDVASIRTLQMFFGYCLLPDYNDLQQSLWLKGPKRAGKGTIEKVLRLLVTRNKALTLVQLGLQFGISGLDSASVGFLSDATGTRGINTNTALALNRLKCWVGGDPTPIERKGVDLDDGKDREIKAKLFATCNRIPVMDSDPALVARIVALRLTKSFADNPDMGLSGRLEREAEGILLWALEGLKLIMSGERMKTPESAMEVIDDLCQLDSSASIKAFIADRFDIWGKDIPKLPSGDADQKGIPAGFKDLTLDEVFRLHQQWQMKCNPDKCCETETELRHALNDCGNSVYCSRASDRSSPSGKTYKVFGIRTKPAPAVTSQSEQMSQHPFLTPLPDIQTSAYDPPSQDQYSATA